MSNRSRGQRNRMERIWYPDEKLRFLRARFHRAVFRGDFDPYLYDQIQIRKMELKRWAKA